MLAFASLVSLSAGVLLAARAPCHPGSTARLETLGGLALVAGLAMIGAGLRPFG